jgi:hypothetical protein
MARSRTRRRAGRRTLRNAKGHFVKRTRTARRRKHRNPSGYIKAGRRWRKITKYAKRRRRGARRGQIAGFKFPKVYRRSRRSRRVRSNPVVVSNPRRSRSRRARRNPYRRHRRYVRRNPGASMRLSADPIAAIKNALMSAFSMDTMESIAQMGLGAVGSIALSKFINAQYPTLGLGNTPFTRVGSTFASGILLTALSALLKKPALTARILTGGLLSTAWQGLSEAIAGTQYTAYIPTLSGSPETEQFRKAIENEVLKELRGGGVHGYLPAAGAEGYSTYLRPAGIEYLNPAGSEAYLTRYNSQQADAGMGAYLTENESSRVDARPSGVGDGDGEFGSSGMTEKF